jgi:hypothetical protein
MNEENSNAETQSFEYAPAETLEESNADLRLWVELGKHILTAAEAHNGKSVRPNSRGNKLDNIGLSLDTIRLLVERVSELEAEPTGDPS